MDDLVIFSRSAKSLQIILIKLESFCENASLSVNLDKTKIMIFNNCGKSLNNYLFRYGADELENLGPVQTPCFCRAELNSGIKFDKSTAEARRLNQTFELGSASN